MEEVDDSQQSNVWTVPIAEEVEQCEQCWISGPVELEEPLDENSDYITTRKQWVNIFCERFCPAKPNFPLSEQVAIIVADYRTYQDSSTDEQVAL